MLPAPTTRATSTPLSTTSRTSCATALTRSASVPYSSEPIRASPESFSRTRLKTGSATAAGSLFADDEPGEPGDHDVLAGARRERLPELLDRLALVHVGADVLLLEQGDFLRPLRDLALDDLLDHVLGLALLGGLGGEHLALSLPGLLGDLLGGHVVRDARRAGDVDRNLTREVLEVVVASDEVGLALDLDHDADPPGRVDVRGDDSLGGRATGALRRRGLAPY